MREEIVFDVSAKTTLDITTVPPFEFRDRHRYVGASDDSRAARIYRCAEFRERGRSLRKVGFEVDSKSLPGTNPGRLFLFG